MSDTDTLLPTPTDLELALAFFSVLVEQARRRETITYGELIERAQAKFPTSEVVAKAIPVAVGRRLDFVREFTRQRALPDLSSLAVNKSTGECGVGFTRSFDPDRARSEVFAHNWAEVSEEFAEAVATVRERALKPKKPKKPLSHDQATRLMSDYYFANRAALPTTVRVHRELIIRLLMSGVAPEEAFTHALR